MEVKVKNTTLVVDKDNFYIEKEGKVWRSEKDFESHIVLNNGRNVLFESAKQIERVPYENEVGKGILTRYRDLKGVNFAFDTLLWIEESSEEVYFEWIPVNDNGFDIKEICWPAPFMLEEGYSLIPYAGGIKVNSTEKKVWNKAFALYGKEGGISCFAQVDKKENAYISVCETPWDVKCNVDHSENYTKLNFSLQPSLGKMNYRRVIRSIFINNANENKLLEIYKTVLKEKGLYKNVPLEKETTYEEVNVIYKDKLSKQDCIQNADGSIQLESLCAGKALSYIKKVVYEKAYKAIYLKAFAFTVEECINPAHRISRKQCVEEKLKVIQYLNAKDIEIKVQGYAEWLYPYVDTIQMVEMEVPCGERFPFFDKIYK